MAAPDRNSGQPSPAHTVDNPRKVLYFDEGAAAGQLVLMNQSPGYIRLPRMRLVVVHEKYWLAILNKDKLIEFRSSKQPILLEAGDSLLFALAMRHRKGGKDALILARVLRVDLLQIDEALEAHGAEAEACNLAGLAANWGVACVRCIVLDKDSIRIAGEIANLSIGCEGIVHQFALATGTPQFCHVSDLGKTVSVALPGGKRVHHTLLRPSSSHHCETRARVRRGSSEDRRSTGEASADSVRRSSRLAAPSEKKRDTAEGEDEEGGTSSSTVQSRKKRVAAAAARPDKRPVQDSSDDSLSSITSVVDALKGILAKLSPAAQAAVSAAITSDLGAPAVTKKRGRPEKGERDAPSSTTAKTEAKSRTRTKISGSKVREATTQGEVEEECNTFGGQPALPLIAGGYRDGLRFVYDKDTRMHTQKWMENFCTGGAYYRAVELMWKSGRHDWTRGKPPPNYWTLHNWRKQHARDEAKLLEQHAFPAVSRAKLLQGALFAIKHNQERKGAAADERTCFQAFMLALKIGMNKGSLVRFLCHSEDTDKHYFKLMV